jgi:hypothetical protein
MIRSFFVGTLLVGLVGGLVFGAVNRTSAKASAELSRVEENLAAGTGEYGLGQGGQTGISRNQRTLTEDGTTLAGIGRNQRSLTDEERESLAAMTRDPQNLSEGRQGSQVTGSRGQGSLETSGQGYRGGQGSLSAASEGAFQAAGGRGQGAGGNGQSAGTGLGIPSPQADAGQWETVQGTVASFESIALVLNRADGSQLLIEGRALAYALEHNFTTSVGNTLVVEGFHEDGEYKPATISDLTTGASIMLRDAGGRPSWAGNGWGEGSSQGKG